VTLLLEARTAIVTGAGQGVGEGIARALAAAGANVVVAARRAETGEPVAEAIRQRGGSAVCLPCDVAVRAASWRAPSIASARSTSWCTTR
jgi:NAD(P)-dependent dehydrogenase (short-subunit alcohol dehydrogenase family)